MAESEKKRRSGRARDDEDDAGERPPSRAAEPSDKAHAPWGPLIWLLIPLIASVAYGVATRGN